jgi:AbiV family abortive infection protein
MAAKKSSPLTDQLLLEGAWHALAQAGRLLNSAATLYVAGDASTALAIAMFAREELGRSMLLRECAREVRGGKILSTKDVTKRCDSHVAKQAASAFSIVLRGGIRQALTDLSSHDPLSERGQAADAMVRSAVSAKQKRQPQQRHDDRCNALYVDLNEVGTAWRCPTDIQKDEARNGIGEAVSDYAMERERLLNSQTAITIRPHVMREEMISAKAQMSVSVDVPAPIWFTLGV